MEQSGSDGHGASLLRFIKDPLQVLSVLGSASDARWNMVEHGGTVEFLCVHYMRTPLDPLTSSHYSPITIQPNYVSQEKWLLLVGYLLEERAPNWVG